jgi:TetR/AcrR family transcriptional regulator, tetracycline repressor protein
VVEDGKRKVGRPRAGEEPLSRARILSTALALVDEEGMGALSMRRLAGELGVDPMAIYHHLPGKEALVSGLVETVFAEMRVPDSGDSWQDRVRAFARAYRDLALSHPNLAVHLVSDPPAAAAATLEANEALYEALAASGMGARDVVRAADLVVDYVNGFALAESAGPLGDLDDRRVSLERLVERPAEQVPTMARVFGELAGEKLPVDFEFGLDVILAGLAARTESAGA